MRVISAGDLDDLMNRSWRARSEVVVDGWIVRRSSGVTQRANSVLPVVAPCDLAEALDADGIVGDDVGDGLLVETMIDQGVQVPEAGHAGGVGFATPETCSSRDSAVALL